MGPLGSGLRVRRGAKSGQATQVSGRRGVLDMHLGRVAAVPFVAADRSCEPPARIGRGGEQCLPKFARGTAEGDPFEALAIIAAADAPDMPVADDAGLD